MKEKTRSFFREKAHKAIAVMLSIAMVLSMVPTFSLTAKAAESGTGIVPRTTALDLTTTGTYNNGTSSATLNPANDITDSAEGWEWHTSGATVDGTVYTGNVLVLKGANIHGEGSIHFATCGIKLPNNTTIVLASGTTNTVIAGNTTGSSYDSYGINASTLTINGTGTLSVTGGTAGVNSYGVYSNTPITISGGTVTATGGTAANYSYGIFTDISNGSISLSEGLVIARSGIASLSNAMNKENSGSLALLTGTNAADFAVYGEKGKYCVIDNEEEGTRVSDGTLAGHVAPTSDGRMAIGLNCCGYPTPSVSDHITWDMSASKLTLKNVIINVDIKNLLVNAYGIKVPSGSTINLDGTNVVYSGDSTNDCHGIFGNDLTLNLLGTSIAISGNTEVRSYGIDTNNLTINGTGKLCAMGGTSKQNSVSSGIYAGVTTTISSGTVTAMGGTSSGSSYGIGTGGITFSGGTVTAIGGTAPVESYGISAGTIAVSGGTGTIASGTSPRSSAMSQAPAFSNGIGFLTGSNTTQLAIWGVLPRTAMQLNTALAENANTSTAATVWYGGKSWRVAGYDGTGATIMNATGEITLVAKNNLGKSAFDNTRNPTNNEYSGSDLQKAIESSVPLTACEKDAIIPVDLTGGSTTPQEGMAGQNVTGAKLWPMSFGECNALVTLLKKSDGSYWVRSPMYSSAIIIDSNMGGSVSTGANATSGVRPALKLNKNSVLFASAATGGKTSGTVGASALTAVPATTPAEWKLTVKDSSRSSFAIGTTAVSGTTLTIGYSGATPYNETTAPNEYISAVVKDANDNITYYGHIAQPSVADGTASVTLPVGFNSASDKLYIFSEQYNGDKITDCASDLQQVSLTKNAYAITSSLTNMTNSNPATYRLMSNTSDYTAALSIVGDYLIPDAITVKIGSTALAAADYTYTNGSITIPNAKITDDITINAAGVTKSYTIAVSPETLTFENQISGYTAPDAKTVAVQNTGNQDVELFLPASANYNIGSLSKTKLAKGETATFTVQPKTGLKYGSYCDSITVSTNHATSSTVSTGFNVLDTTVPTAEINVSGNTWNSFLNTVTFGLFFKETKTVTVTASDADSGVKTIEYLLSNTKFDTKETVTGAWTDITSAKQFSISPNSKQYIYVRVTDNADNVSIVNTDGVVLYTDSSATAADITFTKTGTEDKSTKVTLNGNTVKEIKNGSDVIESSNYTAGEDGKITFKATYLDSLANGKYTLAVSYNPMDETYSEKDGNAAPGTTAINLTVQKSDGEVKNISNLGKTYDGTAVSAPTYDKSGTGAATIKYKVKDADDSTYTTAAPKNAGNYTVCISVAADDNYKAASATADFSIAQKEVTISGVTVASTKEYDGTATVQITNNGTLSANYDGESLKIAAGTAAYNDKTAATGKTVSFTGFTLAGSAKDNYKLTAQPANTTANITKKELTVDVSVKDKLYNGKNDAEFNGTPALNGVVTGDKVNLTNGTATFASTAIANGIAINFTAFSISGADAGNYTLTQPTEVTASIKNFTATKGVEYAVNSNDWLNSDFIVSAKTGFKLSASNTVDGTWSDTLNASEETASGTLEFYVMNTSTGVISDKATENYKIDKTVPFSIPITITTNPVKQVLHYITFGLFFNDTTEVTLSAYDHLSGIRQYEYLLASDDDVDTAPGQWKSCDGSFSIDPQFKGAIIAHAVDNAGNYSSAVCSDRFVVDQQTPTAPNITATVNGKAYNSNWTTGNVELKVSDSLAFSGIDHYEYKIGDSGSWTTMPQQSGVQDSTTGDAVSDMLTITSNTNDTIHFRVVSNSGMKGNESIVTVRKDDVTPSLDVAVSGTVGQWTQDPVTFTLRNTANNVSPVTYWVKTGSDEWTQLSGNTCKVTGNVNTTYQFKAVSGSALTSALSSTYTVKLASDALKEVIKNIDDLPDPNNTPDKEITDNEQLIKDTKILYDTLSKDEQSAVGQDRIDKLNKLIGRLRALLVIVPKDTHTGITAGNIGTSVQLPELNDPKVGKVVVKLAVNPIHSSGAQGANFAIASTSLDHAGSNLLAAFDVSLIKSVFDAAGNQTSTGKVSNSNIKGPITVQIPVPADYQGRTDLQVVYIDDNGKVTPLTTTLIVVDGVQYLQFTTTHFSVYAVTAPAKKPSGPNPDTGDRSLQRDVIPFSGLAILSVTAAIILRKKKNKNREASK